MKTTLSLCSLPFLLAAFSHQCFGMISVEFVSKERAKELGVSFRSNTNGEAGIRVTMEFKTEGELKKITYVELRIGQKADRVMSAPLHVSTTSSNTAVANFCADPAYLPRSSFMIVVYNGPKGDVGYQFNVKDFIELEKSR